MSPLTRYLSRLLGVFLLVTAVAQWTQPGLLWVVFPPPFDQPGLLWVYGMLTFASGLAVVLGHNDWSNNPAAVVSLLGWLQTICGAALLLIPAAGWKVLHFPSHPAAAMIITAVVGAYLTYAGFVRRR